MIGKKDIYDSNSGDGIGGEDKPSVPGTSALPAAQPDPWYELKKFTAARIALGSTGVSVPIQEVLQFRLAHAHARDAVFSAIDENHIRTGLSALSLSLLSLHSSARDRSEYLQRPDLGRSLDESSKALIGAVADPAPDIAIVIADGLSAEAVNRHAVPLLRQLVPGFTKINLRTGPVSLVKQGRVAAGDEIGEVLQTKLLIVLIGERPGLSSPDSLGVYLTYRPRRGITDESRNCVSNIRPEGLDYATAAAKVLYLVRESFRLQLTGVALKEQTPGLIDGI